jgi:hypothetical protein
VDDEPIFGNFVRGGKYPMNNHMELSLFALAQKITQDGVVDGFEVQVIRERVYENKVIDRDEADFFFKVNDTVTGIKNDAFWGSLFVDALTDHFLNDTKSPGSIDIPEGQYLLRKISKDRKINDLELRLLVNIISKAQSCPIELVDFAMEAIKARILRDGFIDDYEVEMVQNLIHGIDRKNSVCVDRKKANFLFDLNDQAAGMPNSPAWKELFVEAIGKHVLEDGISPGVVDEGTVDWLIERISADGKMDENEKALLEFIKHNAKEIESGLE